jgi:antitoxin ParD1/3/4
VETANQFFVLCVAGSSRNSRVAMSTVFPSYISWDLSIRVNTLCQVWYSSDMAIHRTTVNVSITPELDAFLQSRVKSGRYQTTSEVVREALRLLERQERERDEAFYQLKTKLERGATQAENGKLLDGDEVFDELREMIKERRRSKAR